MEIVSRADGGDREDEWVRDMFTAHMNNDKLAVELLAETRSPKDAYECTKQREKGIGDSKTMKINPFGGHQSTIKQDPVNYTNKRGHANYSNSRKTQRGRGARG